MQFKSLAYILLGQSALVAAQSATTTSAAAQATGACEPHEDHWHCPSGVPQPSLNPDGSPNPKATQGSGGDDDHDDDHDHDHDHSHDHDTDSATTAGATTTSAAGASATANSTTTAAATTGPNGCTPHNDHWHCPSGVPKPTTPPPGYTSKASSTGSASGNASASATPKPTSAAGKAGPLSLAVLIGGSVLLGALYL